MPSSTGTLVFNDQKIQAPDIYATESLGVGVSDPTSNLEVIGNAYVSSNLEVGTANLFVDTVSGRVGVGTVSPLAPLHTRGTGQTSQTTFDTSQNLGASIFVQSSDSVVGSGGSIVFGTYQGKFAAIKSSIQDGTTNTQGNLSFMTRNSTSDATLTNRMTITNGGNVGIGTTNPTINLDIHSSGNRIGRRLPSGSVHDADKRDEIYIGRWDGTNLAEFTGMSCQVGSYTDMGYGSCGNQASIKFYNWGCNYSASRLVFEIEGSGTARTNGTSVSSDDRLKTNEEYIENALDTILKLKPQKYIKHNFNYIEVTEDEYSNVIDGNVLVEKSNLYVNVNDLTYHTPTNTWYKQTLSNDGLTEAGIMVQDVWYDAPELRYLISTSKDANIKETRDEIFTDPQEDPDYSDWGKESAQLNYTSLIPYLIKSIQELHDENKSLKRRIETLENYNVYN